MWAFLPRTTSSLNASFSEASRKFRKDEAGSLIVFTLFLLVMVLLIAGTALDTMRHETRRTALQNTLDSAILAAASLDQSLDAEALIKNHVEKAGMDPNSISVSSSDTMSNGSDGDLTARTVTVLAKVETPTMFMNLMGIDDLGSTMASAAEEAHLNIEISLIVDISGSMGWNSKMANLQVAAKDFVNHVLTVGPNAERTSISIIPYNGKVVAGQDLLARLNADGEQLVVNPARTFEDPAGIPITTGIEAITTYDTEHNFSSCVRFRDADFDVREISKTTPLERMAYYSRWNFGYADPDANYSGTNHRWCDEGRSEILVYETNITTLEDHIDGLTTGGWTGIDNGMKWGVALLDPAFQPVIAEMVGDGELPGDLDGRPGAYDPDATKKIVVLMTDGANTRQYDLRDEFKFGPTRVFRAESRSKMATSLDSSDNTFLTEDGTRILNPDGTPRKAAYQWFDAYFVEMPGNAPDQRWYVPGDPNTPDDDFFVGDPRTVIPGDPDGDEEFLVQQDYISMYKRFSVQDFARFFFENSGDEAAFNAHMNAEWIHDANGEIDTRLQAICDAANEGGRIEVFAIGFEAPAGGQQAMENCATIPGNYFNVSGTDISTAFDAIAGQITALRLTN